MILIMGGAYQGKLEYAKERFGLEEGDIFRCSGGELDFSRRCVYGLEEFAWDCAQRGLEPKDYFAEHREAWADQILICRDIFCGVVPLGAENRLWRQYTGRLCQYLGREAEEVVRIFCGLEQRMK